MYMELCSVNAHLRIETIWERNQKMTTLASQGLVSYLMSKSLWNRQVAMEHCERVIGCRLTSSSSSSSHLSLSPIPTNVQIAHLTCGLKFQRKWGWLTSLAPQVDSHRPDRAMMGSAAPAAVPFSSSAAQVLRISSPHPLNMWDGDANAASGSDEDS